MGIAVGCKHFEHAVAYFKNRNVESTAAKVVNHNLLAAFLLVETVCQSGRGRLVYDTQNVQARYFTRILGCLTLAVVEVCGACNNRIVNFTAEIALRVGFEFG